MPLLGKELVEQAARKRTYIVRVVYALLLFVSSAIMLHSVLWYSSGPYAVRNLMGSGLRIVEPLVIFQFLGICLFLPAMMAGTIAGEKEQDSLALLFLTDMGPWEVLLQKYLGRLVPMFSFLLLSLPIMALAYALGGLESKFVAGACWMLFLTCLQVGALALVCSAICSSTVGAFVAAYLSLAALYLLPLLLMELGAIGRGANIDEFCRGLVPLAIFERNRQSLPAVVWASAPILTSILLFLLLGRLCLVRRAFAPARSPVRALFRHMDRTYKRWNDRLGGIVLGRVQEELPDRDPVAWRELHKRSLGNTRYLVRLGLWLEIPALFFGLLFLCARESRGLAILPVIVVWILAALLLTVQGANTIVAERTQQTLEVLLTTPIWGDDIVRQKMRALYRLCLLFAVPLLTLAVFGGMRSFVYAPYYEQTSPAFYLIGSLFGVAIYLPLLAWFSMWIGLRVRTRARAIMTAVVALVCWCLAMPIVLIILEACNVVRMNDNDFFPNILLLLSPAFGVICTVLGWRCQDGLFPAWGSLAMILNFVLYGSILFRLRYACLRDADRLLRRE